MWGKLTKYLIVLFLGAATTCVLVLVTSFLGMAIPKFEEFGWDLLAFIGSIIGGVITYLGVKITITSQREDKVIEKFYQDIGVLYSFLRSSSYILNLRVLELEKKENETSMDHIKRSMLWSFNQINEFLEILERNLSDLIRSLEHNRFELLDVYIKNLSGMTVFIRNFDFYYERDGVFIMSDRLNHYLELSVKIFQLIEGHKEDRTEEYNRIKGKNA
ncbi:hypothetical protein N6H13_07515 [Paenibacillus sp. CC-CFT742]|nr:hypothetical protein [Paenibacillus sp. CC-CFT742]WJH30484.1 hypothetical protein N6H13_07515 [Paenibacillus sp. CC-CFT742]